MNKTALIAALTLAVGICQAEEKKDTKTIACAVMTSNKVNIADATKKKMYSDYKGHRYFFCCGGCPEEFKKNPEKFKKSPSIAIPKKPSK
jgi:YHS domain-containing protein